MKTVGIVGYGEIGRSLDALYLENDTVPLIKDLNRDDGLSGVDVLNVAIPWSDSFITDVRDYIIEIKPRLVIIHSTVPPGTTRKIAKDYRNIVHSPVRGVHPNLLEGLKTFEKIIGGEGHADAKNHLEELGLKVTVHETSVSTEVAKLLDTSYYGVCIAWHDYAKNLCELWGIDFEEAQTRYNETYNDGYTQLEKPNVVRPTLTPPEGKIGGHCIVSNAKLLREILDSPLLQAITNLK